MYIIFDVDETLYDMTQPFERAFKEIWQDRYDIDMHALYVSSRIHSDKVFDQVMAGTMTVDGAGIYRMQHAMEDFGYQISEEEALEFQHIYRKHQRSLDISETMEKILNLVQSRGIAMGILTNGDTGHQMEKIHGMHLEKWFSDDRIFVSDAIGYSIENDIEGAGGAGWHAILLNRRHNDTSAIRHKPDYIVESEEELLKLLERLL